MNTEGTRKRQADVSVEELDPRAGAAAQRTEVISEASSSGTKRTPDESVEDIDPRAGNGSDLASMGRDNVESTQFR